MAASLVQQTCVCTCKGHNHNHNHSSTAAYHPHHQIGAVGLPFVAAPAYNYSGFNHHSPSINSGSATASEHHSFSTSTSLVAGSHGGGVHAELTEPRVYPFKGHVKHTHASYRRESLPELNAHSSAVAAIANGNGHATTTDLHHTPTVSQHHHQQPQPQQQPQETVNGWTLCLPIPVPHGIPNATLESLTYTVRYASLDAGSASVQTDVVLSHGAKIPEGVVTDYSKLALFNHAGGSNGGKGYGPPMVNEALGLVLASVPAFKSDSGAAGWSHYLDHQKVYPNVRIGEEVPHAAHPTHNGAHAAGYHVYLFFHVYEYPSSEALRSISVDVSATWNDGSELQRIKDARSQELSEFKVERERLVIMKREVDLTIQRLEESVKRANEEHERRVKGEMAVEKELEAHQREFLAIEKRAREGYEARMREEARRLKEIDEADLKAKQHHESRLKEEEQRLKALSEAERKAELEHARRLKEEEQRLKEISDAEKHLKSEHEKRASEEEAKMKELEEKQRQFKEETERVAREEKERREREEAAWKLHEEAEAKARKDLEIWTKTQTELKAKEERERQARIEAERVAREEAERRVKEENERRAKEEAERRAKEEAERRAKEEAERRAKAAAAVKAVPSISEAPHVADDHMQEHIAKMAEKLGQKCKNGYAWEKKAHGYKCSGGGHFISFKDLGMQ